MGLASQSVWQETTLTFSHPHCAGGKQRPRGAANLKCVVTRGNVAQALAGSQAWEKRRCPSQRGVGVCFVLIFLLKPEPNQLFKMLLQDRTPLAGGLKRQIQAENLRIPAEPLTGSPTPRTAPA